MFIGMNMEELYNKLKENHALPDFNVLDAEFEISAIEDEVFLLREIRKCVAEKIESSIKFLDGLFHPDPGFASYREAELFNNADREAMISIYRRLMFFKRNNTELTFDDSDELNAKFLNDFMNEWPEIKSSILVFVKRLKDSWKEEISKKEVVGYLG